MIRASIWRALGLLAVAAVGTGCAGIRFTKPRRLPDKIINPYSTAGQAAVESQSTGGLAGGSEELWIIAKGAESASAENPSAAVGALTLPYLRWIDASAASGDRLAAARSDLRAVVAGPVATVVIRQQYRNPFSHRVSAEYVFPLPPNAAIGDFVMTIGTRHIRAIIRKRAEAERIYAEARGAGHVASLLTQERPDSFTQAVANLDPDQQIGVETTYFQTLDYHDGEYELILPMGAKPADDGQHAAPEFSLTVDIDAGVGIESIRSLNHAVSVQRPSNTTAHVELVAPDPGTTQDCVLRYKTAGDELKTALLAHTDQRGTFVTLILQPPLESRQGADQQQPVLSDVEVDWGDLEVSDVHPQPIPDLFPAHPIVLSGRLRNSTPTTLQISGRTDGQRQRYSLNVSAADLAETHPGLVSLWAQAHIAALERCGSAQDAQEATKTDRCKHDIEDIADTALKYGLMTPRTALLAVDASTTGSGASQPVR